MPASVIDPSTFEDEWFGQLSDREMLVWVGVFSKLRDDQGRFVENAALARARLFPYRDVPISDIQDAIDQFVRDGRLHRYSDGQQTLLQIVNWWRHQKQQWAAPSKLPSPEGWTDRVRHRQNGSYQAVNWDSPGGFTCDLQATGSGEEDQANASGEPVQVSASGEEVQANEDVQLNRSGEDLQLKGSEPEPEPEPFKSKSTPLPPKPVENEDARGEEPERRGSAEAEEQSLDSLRRNPSCENRECKVRTLHVGMRGTIAEIVGPTNAGKLYNPADPLNTALAGMAGYICAACWRASSGPGVTMDDREPLCRRALVAYVDTLVAFHRQKPIRSLPAFLRTRYDNLTEAPVSDELLAQLRTLERAEGGRTSDKTSEPHRVGTVLAQITPEREAPIPETQPHAAAKGCNPEEGAA